MGGIEKDIRCNKSLIQDYIKVLEGALYDKIFLRSLEYCDGLNYTELLLIRSCSSRAFHLMEYFIEYSGVDVNCKYDCRTPLIELLRNKADLKHVKYLIGKGANVNFTNTDVKDPLGDFSNSEGEDPLYIAIQIYPESIPFLIDNGAVVKFRHIGAASHRKDVPLLELLMQNLNKDNI